jgi:hypothetical protein
MVTVVSIRIASATRPFGLLGTGHVQFGGNSGSYYA